MVVKESRLFTKLKEIYCPRLQQVQITELKEILGDKKIFVDNKQTKNSLNLKGALKNEEIGIDAKKNRISKKGAANVWKQALISDEIDFMMPETLSIKINKTDANSQIMFGVSTEEDFKNGASFLAPVHYFA